MPWEIELEVMELPRAFATVIDTIPRNIPYIGVPAEACARSRERLGKYDKPKIGIMWGAGAYNAKRSLALEKLSPILRCEQFDYVSLQHGPAREELNSLALGDRLRDAAMWSDSLLDTAAAISNLSLVITVDTVTAHLSGALGRPVWVLLPYQADWRWMISRADSPWYPTMKLFRQTKEGDWKDVINNLLAALLKWGQPKCH